MRINMLVYLKAGETCGIGVMLIRDPRQYAVQSNVYKSNFKIKSSCLISRNIYACTFSFEFLLLRRSTLYDRI